MHFRVQNVSFWTAAGGSYPSGPSQVHSPLGTTGNTENRAEARYSPWRRPGCHSASKSSCANGTASSPLYVATSWPSPSK